MPFWYSEEFEFLFRTCNIDIDKCVCMVSSFLVYIISEVAFRRIEQPAEIHFWKLSTTIGVGVTLGDDNFLARICQSTKYLIIHTPPKPNPII